MSDGLAIAIVGALGAILTPVLVALIGKWKPSSGGAVQVTTVPSTQTVAALAQLVADQGVQISALTTRVGVLETRERKYIERIAQLEFWGANAQGPPPRLVPPWADPPQ